MRPKFIFFLLVILQTAVIADNALPSALPLARYQAMIDHSPFALATEAPAPQALSPNPQFAKNLFLTGAVRLNNSEYITIGSRDQNQAFTLQTGSSYNGISLVSVAWSEGIGKTRATLKCGTEFATITFDEATLRQPANDKSSQANQSQPEAKPALPSGIVPPNTGLQAPPSPRRGNRLARPAPSRP